MMATHPPKYDYAHLIGSELRVGYFDQNESFAQFLPLTGVVTQQVTLDDGTADWLALQLNEPFDYQTHSTENGYRGHHVTHLLICSRWAGYPIGREQTSVFVLLDINHVLTRKSAYALTDFLHICWGMVPPQ